ncbi:MAG: hypothetical protein ACP5RI_01075 [Candidatus Micrarchaeia archaeon]
MRKNNTIKIKKESTKRISKKDSRIIKDAHILLYNKEFYEAEYLEMRCPICNSRIDELGLCACDSAK